MLKYQSPNVTLLNVPDFKKKSDTERRDAYMRAFKPLAQKLIPPTSREKRRQLLDEYIKVAGWDEESVRTMESAVSTPIH